MDSIEDWEAIEARITQSCDLSQVRDRETFIQAVTTQFFQQRHPEHREEWVHYRPSLEQLDMVEEIWERYQDDIMRRRGEINIFIKQYPEEARRYAKAIKNYPNILKEFLRGKTRKTVATETAEKHGKSWKTIDRDIFSMVKIGILEKTKKRGFYKVKSNLYV